jgi:coproporphyrinogen III oxidase-like Fe-S oxidoreductase
MNCPILANRITSQKITPLIGWEKNMGIGPSAHGYNGISRSWNVSNNIIYLKSIQEEKLPNEIEVLS